MRRRMSGCVLVLILVVGFLNYRLSPAVAASPDDNAALANWLPATTVVYANVRTADFQKDVQTLVGIVGKLSGSPVPDPLPQLDAGLTQFLGRPASLAKDVLPWLGDHVAVGYILSDADMKALFSSPNSAQGLVVLVSVKDQTAGDAFFKETLAKVNQTTPNLKATPVQIGGAAATLYAGLQIALVQAKGFYAVGQPGGIFEMNQALELKKPPLRADAGFTATMKLLKSGNLMNAYISPRLYQGVFQGMGTFLTAGTSSTSSAKTLTAMQNIYGAIHGQAFVARIDGKTLRFDVEQSYDSAKFKVALQNLYGAGFKVTSLKLPALSALWAAKIPASALLAVGLSGGLSDVYQEFKDIISSASSSGLMPQSQADQAQNQIKQVEAYIQSQFQLELQKDVFSWMSGEATFYLTYNPDSVLNKVASASSSTAGAPFDITFMVKSGNMKKTADFIQKLTTGLKKIDTLTVTDAGHGFSTISSADGYAVSYGLSGNTFVLTTSSGLAGTLAALQGKAPLSGSAAWKNAQKTALPTSAAVMFVSGDALLATVKAMTPPAVLDTPQNQQSLKALGNIESMAVYASIDNSTSAFSVQLTLR
ncbi:MAG TPA: DUF3352 domain-containing protein [Aggregatilineaceae bacterium]|nr:DUF3352 domain-containing protein [Aggregatilineaceae bacterium]